MAADTNPAGDGSERHWRRGHTVSLIVMLAIILGLSTIIPPAGRIHAWWLTLLVLALFVAVTGHGITGLWRGLFVDEQNKISLSRFQLALWTVLIVGSYLVAALFNIRTGGYENVAIKLSPEIWALLGISAASSVATPLINYNKSQRQADPAAMAQAVNALQAQVQSLAKTDAKAASAVATGGTDRMVENKGELVFKTNPAYAQWSDMFRSSDAGNADVLDLGKVQMFFFTLVLGLAYTAALGQLLRLGQPVITEFPPLGESMVGLLGISHATYLAKKALPTS